MMTTSPFAGAVGALEAQGVLPPNSPKGPPRTPEDPFREEPSGPEPPGPPEQDVTRH